MVRLRSSRARTLSRPQKSLYTFVRFSVWTASELAEVIGSARRSKGFSFAGLQAGGSRDHPLAGGLILVHRRAALRLAAATALFAGLLVIGDALDVLGETFLLTHLLKSPKHLFGGLVATQLHFDHSNSFKIVFKPKTGGDLP